MLEKTNSIDSEDKKSIKNIDINDFIKVNNIDIHYKISGIEDINSKDKPTIVFIHGLSDDLEFWTPLVNEFKSEYKTLSYDIRGHGKSETGEIEGSIETYQEELYELLKKLNIENAIFIGLSMGGNIALKIATEHPELTKGLVLISTYGETTPKLRDIFKEFENNINIKYESFYDKILPYCLPSELIEKHKDSLDILKIEKAKTASIEGILNGIHAGEKFEIMNELENIKVPTLILTGEDDEITTVKMQEKLHKNIKNSEMIIFPNTKHNLLIGENIEKVIELIYELLNKV